MAGFIYRFFNLFFGASDAATARHFDEQKQIKAAALDQWLNSKAETFEREIGVSLRNSTAQLRPYEAFGVAKPAPIPSPTTSKKQAILNFIKSHSPKGVTAETVGKAFPAWRYSTVTARISELYKAGEIVSVGISNTSVGSLASLFAVAKN